MAVNWTIFEQAIRPYFKSGIIPSNTDDAANYIANIYDTAVRVGSTAFGNFTLSTNKSILVSSLKTAFKIMHSAGNIPISKSAYTVMATGFVGYWTGATMSPLPPHPPTVLPAVPSACFVVYPGDIASLSVNLENALTNFSLVKTASMTTTLFSLALKMHLLTVTGFYLGLFPYAITLAPFPPIPWVGIF
jgi:hypothetical protein